MTTQKHYLHNILRYDFRNYFVLLIRIADIYAEYAVCMNLYANSRYLYDPPPPPLRLNIKIDYKKTDILHNTSGQLL